MKIVYYPGDKLRLKPGVLDGQEPIMIGKESYQNKEDLEKGEDMLVRRLGTPPVPMYISGKMYRARLKMVQ